MDNSYVYIAGPYMAKGGGHDWAYYPEIDEHINEARRWAIKLVDNRIPYFCPHLNSAHFEVFCPAAKPEFWYNLDNLFLPPASALLLIPGWLDSRGARDERGLAESLGIPCYNYGEFYELVAYWETNAIQER